MTEDELRTLVRTAIAQVKSRAQSPRNPLNPREHPSHSMFRVISGGDDAGSCIIEPAVPCNHCGYCKSMGH